MENKDAIYDKEIAPLVDKIVDICTREHIPFIIDFVLEKKGENILHCTTARVNERIKVPEYKAIKRILYKNQK